MGETRIMTGKATEKAKIHVCNQTETSPSIKPILKTVIVNDMIPDIRNAMINANKTRWCFLLIIIENHRCF